jgi:hypothetical protein
VSISPTFYELLLHQNPFAKNYKPKVQAHKSCAKKLSYEKAAPKMLVKITPSLKKGEYASSLPLEWSP